MKSLTGETLTLPDRLECFCASKKVSRDKRGKKLTPKILIFSLLFFYGTHGATQIVESFDQFPSAPDSDALQIIRGDISYDMHTPITLNQPGVYRLTGPLSASAGITALTISANNVTLDLEGNTISGGTTGIAITGNNVAIKNGTIQNTSATGITMAGNNCALNTLDVINSSTAFLLQNTHSNSITNCRALSNTSAGFSLVSSYTNNITNCQALNTNGGSHSAYGFISQFGAGNTIAHCRAQNTQTASTSSSALAAGFFLIDSASTLADSRALNTTSLTNQAQAYGIKVPLFNLLDSQAPGDAILSTAWSPDGQYLAVGGVSTGGYDIRIYAWNTSSSQLEEIITARTNHGTFVASVAWSPDGTTLAIGGDVAGDSNSVRIYAWNGSTLTLQASANPSVTYNIASVAWSPNGGYLAATSFWQAAYLYSWSSPTLTYKTAIADTNITTATWLSDSALVTGSYNNGTNVHTYSWNGTSYGVGSSYNVGSSNNINCCVRATASSLLALGGASLKWPSGTTDSLYLYSYSGTTLTPITSISPSNEILSLAWSPDGTRLVAGKTNSPFLSLYGWENQALTELGTAGTPPGATVYAVSYAPSNSIASGGNTGTNNFQLRAWNTWENNTITDNLAAYTHTQALFGAGVGIAASSAAHYVAANTSYQNTIDYQEVEDQYITSQANARGVYNIDTALATPDMIESINANVNTIVQTNWSVESKCEGVSSKLDSISTLVNNQTWSIESKADTISSKIDGISTLVNNQTWSIESKADTISSKIDPLMPALTTIYSKLDVMDSCPFTPIRASGTTLSNKNFISGPITLTQSGTYCLSGNCSGGITISGSNITLDLNNYTITGGTNGLSITSAGTNAIVRNGSIKNATANGVSIASNSCILENIDVVSTPTGFAISSASFNLLNNCRALACTQNGFILQNATYNTLSGCAVNNMNSTSSNANGFYAANGQHNTCTNCGVTTLSTSAANATAQGFRFESENYSTVTNCTINGISTTQNSSTLYGMYIPPATQNQNLTYNDNNNDGNSVAWLEYQGNRYIAVGCPSGATQEIKVLKYNGTQLTQLTSQDWGATINSVAWNILAGTPYLVIGSNNNGGTGTYEMQGFSFNGSTLSLIANFASSTGSDVRAVAWSDSGLVAEAAVGFTIIVYQFTPPSATAEVGRTNTTQPCNALDYVTIESVPYLVVGLNTGTSSSIRVLQSIFGLPSYYNVSTNTTVKSVRWLATNAGKYYVATGEVSTGNNPNVRIFQWDNSAQTLTQIASYQYGTNTSTVNSVSWLPGVDGLNLLAIAGDYATNEVQILRFDGQCLTPVYTYADPNATTVLSVDWLTTGSAILALGVGGTNTITVRTLGFSPARNTFSSNSVSNVHGGASATAYAIDPYQYLINNEAFDNDTNYYYTPQYGDSNQGFAQGY